MKATMTTIFLALVFSASASAQSIKRHCFDDVGCWHFVRYGDYIDASFESVTSLPVTTAAVVRIGVNPENYLRVFVDGPGMYHAGQFRYPTQNVVKWKFMLFAGSNGATHDDDVVYELPFAAGRAMRVSQGYNGPTTHRNEHRHAIDFSMPLGTSVLASRAGVVALIVDAPCDDVTGTGCANVRVDVRHADGSFATYQHLQPGSLVVRPGDEVSAGEVLANSGNSGRSAGPHLHFQVYAPTPDGERIVSSLPTSFATTSGVRQLEPASSYERPVRQGHSDEASAVSR